MRIWGGLPTTGPEAPPSGPGRHRAARAPARRAQITPPLSALVRGPQAAPAGARRALAGLPQQAGRDPGGRCAPAPTTSPGSSPAPPPASTSRSPSAPGGSPVPRNNRPARAAAGRRRRGRLARGCRHGRRPGRRGGSPARLVPGGYAAAAPSGPGRAC